MNKDIWGPGTACSSPSVCDSVMMVFPGIKEGCTTPPLHGPVCHQQVQLKARKDVRERRVPRDQLVPSIPIESRNCGPERERDPPKVTEEVTGMAAEPRPPDSLCMKSVFPSQAHGHPPSWPTPHTDRPSSSRSPPGWSWHAC